MRAAIYLRVSTDRQTVANQREAVRSMVKASTFDPQTLGYQGDALRPLAEVSEVESGAKRRPLLAKLCASLRAGDVLAVWAMDRLGRNALETVSLVQGLLARGVRILSVQEAWLDQPGPARELLVMVFAWVAQQERARLIERTRAGVATARAAGKTLGRPKTDARTLAVAVAGYRSGAGTLADCAAAAGVSRSTLKRALALAEGAPHV
jgi:putative DNA-invertase from lambdoid prophage Rac